MKYNPPANWNGALLLDDSHTLYWQTTDNQQELFDQFSNKLTALIVERQIKQYFDILSINGHYLSYRFNEAANTADIKLLFLEHLWMPQRPPFAIQRLIVTTGHYTTPDGQTHNIGAIKPLSSADAILVRMQGLPVMEILPDW